MFITYDRHATSPRIRLKKIRDYTGIRLITLLIHCWFLQNIVWLRSYYTCIKHINMHDTDACALYSIQSGLQIVDMLVPANYSKFGRIITKIRAAFRITILPQIIMNV